jgi:hypothetical protein
LLRYTYIACLVHIKVNLKLKYVLN